MRAVTCSRPRFAPGTAALLLLLAIPVPPAAAATVYIHDQLYVPLRDGQSENTRVVQGGLRSGTAAELLDRNEQSGYSRIRLEDGTEGWIQTQYLTTTPIARDRLQELEARYAEAQAKLQDALKARADRKGAEATLTSENNALKSENAELNGELARVSRLAADAVKLDELNKALREQQQALVGELDEVNAANGQLRGRKEQEWFWLGGGTVLGSLLLGMWIGRKIYGSRKSGGWA